jgi:opacity protein-like surface antigen
MKRLIAAACLAVLSAPAFAQAPSDDVKAFLSKYVAAFNKGDAAALSKDYYATPGASAADTQAKLEAQYAKLRGDEFGKLDLYSFKSCKADAASAEVQMDFAFQYTYGGVMPPGDQATVLKLAKTADGWRIVSGVAFAPGQCS